MKYKFELAFSIFWIYIAYINRGDNASMFGAIAIYLIIANTRSIMIKLDEIKEK